MEGVAHRTVDDVGAVVGKQGGERFRILGGERDFEARQVRRRGVGLYAPTYRGWGMTPIFGRLRLNAAAGSTLRRLGEDGGAFGLPELNRARLFGGAFAGATGGAQCGSECQPCVGMMQERVGGRGDLHRGARELDGGAVFTASRQRLGTYAAPGDRRLQVVTSERLAF